MPGPTRETLRTAPETLRVAILGNPSTPHVPWTDENVAFLAAHGFNAVQLNIAWSWRPADEPLNLEDVAAVNGNPLPGGADPSTEAWHRRRSELVSRSAVARRHGLRTIFHCGVPYNGRTGYRDGALQRCILDPATPAWYTALLQRFARDFPDVDDLLVYTYDQDAWLCSEFGSCPRCRGIPLHERLPQFLNALGHTWARSRPGGRVWWEPWELSAGQSLACVARLDPAVTGVMVHSSAAEVMSTNPVDRYVKNLAAAAAGRGIPLVVELFLTAATEEVEPLRHLAVPLVTVRQMRAVAELPGPAGVKEYFGIVPDPADPNLAVAGAFLRGGTDDEDQLLAQVAAGYGGAAARMAQAWREASAGYELIPWDASWFLRQIGRSMPQHALSAATVRGMQSGADQWNTPSWRSTRRTGYMRTDNSEPHPWLLEDVQLRCELAIPHLRAAAALLAAAIADVPEDRRRWVRRNADELAAIEVRLRAYALHLRATNLATTIRRIRAAGDADDTGPLVGQLRHILAEDLRNQERARVVDTMAAVITTAVPNGTNEALVREQGWLVTAESVTGQLDKAISLLDTDIDEFLSTYLTVPPGDAASHGQFSVTSR